MLHAHTQRSSGRENPVPSKPAVTPPVAALHPLCLQEGGCSQFSGILPEPTHNNTPTFCHLPHHALTPSQLFSHLPVSLHTHSHFPLLTPNPPISTFLIHLPAQLHKLSPKHLPYTQEEELCLPSLTCLCLSHERDALHQLTGI